MNMEKHDLILIATSSEQANYFPASATIALATISYWLRKDGMNAALFPEDESVTVVNACDALTDFLSENSAPFIGISCWSNSFTTAVEYCRQIRRIAPDTIIIGGGAHFNYMYNIENALDASLFDIIFHGGADPFLEFMSNVASGATTVQKNTGRLIISGPVPNSGLCVKGGISPRRGKLSRAAAPISYISDTGGHISALFSDFCSNGCDYCTVNMSKTPAEAREDTARMVASAYEQLKATSDLPVKIALMDSSPFLDKNKTNTVATLERLSGLGRDISYNVFADPLDLDDSFAEVAVKHNITTIFIGRDRVSEDLFMGRRHAGKVRTSELLDKEKNLLVAFIEKMALEPIEREIYVSYIASPFEAAQNLDLLIDEVALYLKAATGKVVVYPSIFILNPYGGTKVARRAEGMAWDVSEFSYPYPNAWYAAETVMVWLELVRFIVSPLFSTGNLPLLALAMLKFARDYEFGERKPAPLPSGLTPKMKSVAEKLMDDIIKMKLGDEKTLSGWFLHLEEIYYRGFLLAGAAMNEEQLERYGADMMLKHIKRYDVMINQLRKDFELLRSKTLSGSWYARFIDL
jgi:hypothetical protein